MGRLIKICIFSVVLCVALTVSATAATISGNIREAKWGPYYKRNLSGVQVYLRNDPSKSAVSDSSGNYTISDVSTGEYYVVFSKKGFEDDMKKVSVTRNNQTRTVNMAMVEENVTTTSDKYFFDNYVNLDYPGLEKVKEAYAAGDIMLSKAELIEYYKVRTWPRYIESSPKLENLTANPNANTSVADLLINGHKVLAAGKTYEIDFPDRPGVVNFSYEYDYATGEIMFLHRHVHMSPLVSAWQSTLKPDYAYEYMAQYMDWAQRYPAHFRKIDATENYQWATLAVAIRLGYSTQSQFFGFLHSEEITTNARIVVIKTMIEQTLYLSRYTGYGNWLISEASAMNAVLMRHPYLKFAERELANSEGRLSALLSNTILPDGWHDEITPDYQAATAAGFSGIARLAKRNDMEPPFQENLLKMYKAWQQYIKPDGGNLRINDSSTGPNESRGIMREAAELYYDTEIELGQGFVYTATDNRAGTPLKEKSTFYDWAGYIHMRDYYGLSNIFGFFEVGTAGTGHGAQHEDKLNFLLSAYGRELISEGGCYNYTNDENARVVYRGYSHNIMYFNGESQVRRSQSVSDPITDATTYFADDFDYAEGKYDEGFGEFVEPSPYAVEHTRSVFFNKGEYFILSDLMMGDIPGTHTFDQYWNLYPCKWQQDAATKAINTKFETGGNVLIYPADGADMTTQSWSGVMNYNGKNHMKGWMAAAKNYQEPSPTIALTKTGKTLPNVFETVIYPYEGSKPNITVTRLTVANSIGASLDEYKATGLVIAGLEGNAKDYYIKNRLSGTTVRMGEFAFNGEAALIRTDASGKVISVKKYPENSTLTYQGTSAAHPAVILETPASGASLAKSPAAMEVTVKGVDLSKVSKVEYYAKYDGSATFRLVAASSQAPFSAAWDISGIDGQNYMSVYARLYTTDGKTVNSVTNKEIEIDRFTTVPAHIESEDKSVTTHGEVIAAYVIYGNNFAARLSPGAKIERDFFAESEAEVNLFVNAGRNEGGKIKVYVNGDMKQEITIEEEFKDYKIPLGAASSTFYNVVIENTGEGYVFSDKIKMEVADRNLMNYHIQARRSFISDDSITYGSSAATDQTLTAKVKLAAGCTDKDGAGIGAVARFASQNGYAAFYNITTGNLEIKSKNGISWTVIQSVPFAWDFEKWYNIKISTSGSNIRAKLWLVGAAEPSAWTVEAADSVYKEGPFGILADRSEVWMDDVVLTDSSGKEIFRQDFEGVLKGGSNGTASGGQWGVFYKGAVR